MRSAQEMNSLNMIRTMTAVYQVHHLVVHPDQVILVNRQGLIDKLPLLVMEQLLSKYIALLEPFPLLYVDHWLQKGGELEEAAVAVKMRILEFEKEKMIGFMTGLSSINNVYNHITYKG